MINTIIFDIGKVLIDWHPVLTGIFDEETAKHVSAAVFGSGLWAENDLGIRTDEEIWADMESFDPDYRQQVRYLRKNQHLLADGFPYTQGLIRELKEKGYRVLYLSNYSKGFREAYPEVLSFVKDLDGGIFSCDVKLVKPDKRIYEKLIEDFLLVPDTCLFLDDVAENVEAARACGIHAIQFMGYEKTYPLLCEYLSLHGI